MAETHVVTFLNLYNKHTEGYEYEENRSTFCCSFGPVAESSSAATAALAAKWVKAYAGNCSATHELLKNSGVATSGFAATAVNVLD